MKTTRKDFSVITKNKISNEIYVSKHQDRFIYIINKINNYYSDKSSKEKISVLDFGSHTGILGVLFQHFNYKITSIDLEEVIDDYNEVYENNNLEVDKLLPNWEKLPYPDNSFDSIIFTEVLEHLYESPIKILEEFYRILKPNGILLITTPNVNKIENKIRFLFHQNIYQDIKRYCYNPRYSLHFREYTEKDLKILLSEFIKFNKLTFSYFDYVGGRTPTKRLLQRIVFIFSSIFRNFGGSICVIAKK